MIVCSPQLGLSPNSILGGEVFDREILIGLAKKGIKVDIIIPKGLPHDKRIKNINVNYIPFAHFPALFFNILVLPYLFKINAKNTIDIIRLHQPQFTGIAALVFKTFYPKAKIVATYHRFNETKFGFLSKFFIFKWNHIFCDSEAVKNKIHLNYKVPKDKITVVHNGVPKYLKPEAPNKQFQNRYKLKEKSVLLYMGLFIERKNPIFLLKVLKKLIINHPSTVLLYLGKGPLEKQIIKTAKNLGLSNNIRILKPILGPSKNKIYSISDIFVHPALDEGFALAPLEAMACGKPVIMNNSHSAKEAILEGYTGYLCETNNIASWVNKIADLLKYEKKRKEMGANALLKVKKEFSWEIAINIHLKVLERLKSQ